MSTAHGVLRIAGLVVIVQARGGVDLEDHPAGVAQRAPAVGGDDVDSGQAHPEQARGTGGLGDECVTDLLAAALVELRAVGVDDRPDEHRPARGRDRPGREPLLLQGEDGVQIGDQLPRALVAGRDVAPPVLGGHQLTDRGASVADELGREAAHRVEQSSVEEQEAVVVTRHLALDEQPLRYASGPKPRSAKLRDRAHPARGHRSTLQVDRLDDARTRPGVEEPRRGRQIAGREERVLGDRETLRRDDRVTEGLVEGQLERHDVVQRHPVVPHDHPAVGQAQLQEAPRQVGRRPAQLAHRVGPPLEVARSPAIGRARPGTATTSLLAPRVADADRPDQIEPGTHRRARGAGAPQAVEHVFHQRHVDPFLAGDRPVRP